MQHLVKKPLPKADVTPERPRFEITKKRTRIFGLSIDEIIKGFFGGNALVAIIVLGLIIAFLFREGAGFFGQNYDNLLIYRRAGLEYVDKIRAQENDHTALNRYLSDLRQKSIVALTSGENPLSIADANERLAAFDGFADAFDDTIGPIHALASELGDAVIEIKTKFSLNEDKKVQRAQLLAENQKDAAAQVVITPVDFATELRPVLDKLPLYRELNRQLAADITALLDKPPPLPVPALEPRLERFRQLVADYTATFPQIESALAEWDYSKSVPWYESLTAFLFGREWLTASFWQDWHGILPLLSGSVLVSIIALIIAVPLAVSAAIYVNQLSTQREQRLIKPSIEFISAIPSVVLGFFGIAVLGELLRRLSQIPALDWLPCFPIIERLNALTAGMLLALISIPTIFTLTEDALNNVPRAFKEASFALGASRLQTIIRIIAPAALSGIISAILLGFGRVIGETMVVLLCAGNRIAIPDFTAGLGVFTQPVHTMTGIIAQEMGEVARGTIHYRALFVVGIVLFFLALLINYVAQKIVAKYRLPST